MADAITLLRTTTALSKAVQVLREGGENAAVTKKRSSSR